MNLTYESPDFEKVKTFHEHLLKRTEKSRVLEGEGLTLTLARGALMAADHAVSFGVKQFLKDLPRPGCSPSPRPFQLKAGEHEGHLILEAPTGAGKTEAAVRWISRNRKAGERIFYLLPNRASIHAMYHTLAEKYFHPEYVGFLHARALNYLFELYESEKYEEAYLKARQEKDINFLFYKPLKILTPYQVLKWFFGVKRFEVGLLELLGGLFVFDEIHAYDPHTTALITEMVALLSDLGGRFLSMSATIPDFILSELESALKSPVFHLKLSERNTKEKELLLRPRHRVFFREAHLEDLLEEMAAQSRNRKVLVVANRVDQAQAIYRRLREEFGLGKNEVDLIHSRFTYEDRNRKERRLMEILKNRNDFRILVATQVIEVSLDISFDAMFTEIAPVDDLLQRMGRVNRYGESEAPAEIHIATLYEKTPYKRFYLEKALEALMAADHAVSFGVKQFLKDLPRPGCSPSPRPFQLKAGEHEGHLILEAPTGAGKTEAAVRWISRNRKAGERIFYLLPNRASIHAMYHTLAEKYFHPEYVGFLHARALNYLFELYESEKYEEAYLKARQEKDINFLFYKPLKILTPYQVLKWFFGVKRFEVGLLELLGGLFVFDEIHAYDPHTTALITEMVALLSDLGGRFLSMSATIPDFILSELESALKSPVFHLKLSERNTKEKELLLRPRHRVFFREAHLEDLLEEMAAQSRNRKVLVVANRVDQAQAIYRRLREEFGLGKNEVDLIHSRFTYEDRNRKERRLMEILKNRNDFRILVATQVIEVSLDISFDAMFTEIAPVDDLLQRMGRVNRYGESEAPAEIHIATLYEKTPYKRFYLEKALESRPEDGSELNAEKASLWLKKAYKSGFSPEDRDKYRRARESFRRLVEELKPLRGRYEEEYFDLFRIYEVLPVSKSSLFEEYIGRGEILRAFQLLVPVPEPLWHKFKKDDLLEPFKNRTVLAQVKYDPEQGLISDPEFTESFW